MKTESEGSLAYEDFLREEGCPMILRRDNSKMQTSDFRHFCMYPDAELETPYDAPAPKRNPV